MKKIIVSVFAMSLLSCSVTGTKNERKIPLYEVLSTQSNAGARIRFFEIITEANEMAMLLNDENLKSKIKTTDLQISNFIVLNMGEKSTGGYSIGIDTVVETDSSIIITVKENSPADGSFVTQAFTYPFCVVKINSKKEIIFK